ncbi:MAG: transglutaminase domain-containing protein [Pseudomonadales bacterium]
MPIRLIHGVGVLALLGCLAWLLAEHTAPAIESAQALRGERWYRLLLDDRHVGYLTTRTRRDGLGRWRFDSDLRFVLNPGNPVRMHEHLLFAATDPHVLLEASQRNQRGASSEGTAIVRTGSGYRVHRLGDGSSAEQPGDLALSFTLGDYLGFESWLRERNPAAGATVSSSALDFGRRQVVARQFRVVGRNATGYELENPAPFESTRIQLDSQLRPVAMTLSGLFQLEQTSRAMALAPRTALQAASYFVPSDRRLPDHTDIRLLEIEVSGAAGAGDLWPDLASGNALRREADAVSNRRLAGDELAETGDHPVSDGRIRELARTATAGADTADARVDALTRFVNGYLRYSEDGAQRHVLTLLDEPRGDCSEYADLLTTLARSLGIPARTVFGLAYADGEPPAFRFHAWNELLVDGRWRAVDPTWNQLRIDATHIPLPADSGRTLELLTGGLNLSFVIRDVEYF